MRIVSNSLITINIFQPLETTMSSYSSPVAFSFETVKFHSISGITILSSSCIPNGIATLLKALYVFEKLISLYKTMTNFLYRKSNYLYDY